MSEQQVKQSRTLCQLERVSALVGQQSAHVDGEVLLVGQRGRQGQDQSVIVRPLVEVDRKATVGTILNRNVVLVIIIRGWNSPLNFRRALASDS